jgi:hypothetical protein
MIARSRTSAPAVKSLVTPRSTSAGRAAKFSAAQNVVAGAPGSGSRQNSEWVGERPAGQGQRATFELSQGRAGGRRSTRDRRKC